MQNGVLDVIAKNLKKRALKMTKYNCGHESDGIIIMDSNELSLVVYLTWAETVGVFGTKEQCFDCYCKKSGKEVKQNDKMQEL